MRVGSLFSGIGGFDLAFDRQGFELAWACEIEPYPRKVLAQRFPGVPVYEDVRAMNGKEVPPVDVLVGGFPVPRPLRGGPTARPLRRAERVVL